MVLSNERQSIVMMKEVQRITYSRWMVPKFRQGVVAFIWHQVMFFSSFFRFTDRGRRKIFYYLKPGIPSNILYVKGSVWQPYFNFRHRSQLLQVFHQLNALNITRHLQIHKLFKDSNLAYRKFDIRSGAFMQRPCLKHAIILKYMKF